MKYSRTVPTEKSIAAPQGVWCLAVKNCGAYSPRKLPLGPKWL
jgi:hypothetical protein